MEIVVDDRGYIKKIVLESHPHINLKYLVELYGRSEVINGIKNIIISEDMLLREVLVKMLWEDGEADCLDVLIYALSDNAEAWRWHLCGVLSNFNYENSIYPLIKVLLEDDDPDTRFMAAFALGKIGDERAIDPLKHAKINDTGRDYEGRRVSTMAEESIVFIRKRLSDK
jgi:HEAT repeats